MKDNKQKTVNKKKYNLLLLFGLVCILFGIIFQICLFNSPKINWIVVQSSFLAFVGAFLLFLGFVQSHKFRFFFPGLFLSQSSIFWLIVNNVLYNFSFVSLWPVLLIIIGESILIATAISNKKMNFYVWVPSLSFILLGIVFLLFSIDIIKIPFIAFATTWWPIMLVLAGIVLVVIFFYKQADKQDTEAVINDNEET